MNQNAKEPSPVAFSISLYVLLLAAYPSGFRHEYGPHMAQVFRDCCLRSYRQAGLPGMLNLWILTLIDFIKSVLEEHIQRGIHMSKSTFIRLSGWALALGAVTFMIVIISSARDVPEYHPNNYLSSPIDLYFEYATLYLLPASMLLWVIGMIGIFFRFKDEGSVMAKYSPILGIIGAALSFLITLSWSLEISLTSSELDWWMFIGSLSMYFLALVFFGIASIRDQLLPRWNALPIIAGSWLLILWLLSVFDIGNGDITDPLLLGLTLLSMLCLVILGITLRSDVREEAALA